MVKQSFSHVSDWVFDLDNTLYPPSARLFDQIRAKMTEYVMETLRITHAEADRLRDQYWRDHGTTLAGLMREHHVDPEPYMVAVHDISFHTLTPDVDLAHQIANLPGKRIVFTNGSAPYAERVLEARGLSGLFDGIYGVEHADYIPKPTRQSFDLVFEKAGIRPQQAAMFEDDARNLAAPHEMGMRTVHVAEAPQPEDHIHHHTDDLTDFLHQISA